MPQSLILAKTKYSITQWSRSDFYPFSLLRLHYILLVVV